MGGDGVKKLKKIILIGPVYPYKGGISHYTGMMYRTLHSRYDVKMVSYKMQYPKILFKKEQRDYSNDAFQIPETKYLIHTANPINWIKTARQINKWAPDLVIIQWWHPYFSPCYWCLCRMIKSKILFVCHNVFPHERFPMDKLLTKMVMKCGDYYIVHSKMDGDDLQSIVPNARFRQTVLPTFNTFKFEDMSKQEGRKLVGLPSDEKVLLFFGFVREYKGLKHLIRALPKVVDLCENIKLLIVGDFGDNKQLYVDLIQECGVEKYIEIHDEYIPDKEVEKYFTASDLVVLPYESATQSGIVQIAYSFEKPVIVTNVGGLPDVVSDGKTGYVVEPQKPDQLADAIIRFYKEQREDAFIENVRKEAYRFSWDRMAEVIEDLWND